MKPQDINNDIAALPPEAQQQVFDFMYRILSFIYFRSLYGINPF